MEKKRWICAVSGMNTLVHRVGALLAVSTLLVLGTSTPVMAKCDQDLICEKGENAKNCPIDCQDPVPPEAGGLTAIVSGGTFVFPAKSVVLNAFENTATSNEKVTLFRPANVGVGTDRTPEEEWDAVFLGGFGFDGCGLLGRRGRL